MFKKILGVYLATGIGVALADDGLHRMVKSSFESMDAALDAVVDDCEDRSEDMEKIVKKTKRLTRFVSTTCIALVYSLFWPVAVKEMICSK